MWIQIGVMVWKWLNWFLTSVTFTFDIWPWPIAWTSLVSLLIIPVNLMMIQWWEHSEQGKSEGFDSCNGLTNLTPIGFKSSIFQPMWPWNLMDDLEKQKGTSRILYQALCIISNPSVSSNWSYNRENTQFVSKLVIFCPVWPWNLMDDLGKQ